MYDAIDAGQVKQWHSAMIQVCSTLRALNMRQGSLCGVDDIHNLKGAQRGSVVMEQGMPFAL